MVTVLLIIVVALTVSHVYLFIFLREARNSLTWLTDDLYGHVHKDTEGYPTSAPRQPPPDVYT